MYKNAGGVGFRLDEKHEKRSSGKKEKG